MCITCLVSFGNSVSNIKLSLDGLPVDAWVVQRDVLDPARYVDMWIRDSGGQLMDRADYERAFTSWLADFRRAGTGAIGMGFVALRRQVLPGKPATCEFLTRTAEQEPLDFA